MFYVGNAIAGGQVTFKTANLRWTQSLAPVHPRFCSWSADELAPVSQARSPSLRRRIPAQTEPKVAPDRSLIARPRFERGAAVGLRRSTTGRLFPNFRLT